MTEPSQTEQDEQERDDAVREFDEEGEDEPCNQRCIPESYLYEGKCPRHGFRALIKALGGRDPEDGNG